MTRIKAALLVGGMGTRLRAVVPSSPKPLANVGNRPFLELIVRQLKRQGVRHLLMCTGYMADQIENQFREGHNWDVEIEYSRESQPLGTAGALRHARTRLGDAADFLVLNGDSFLEINFENLVQFHCQQRAVATLAVVRVDDAARYGTLSIDDQHRVTSFLEKTGVQGPGIVNAGIYVFSNSIFDYIPHGPASLEKDVFPQLVNRGVYGLEQRGAFIDIGTPEDYALAQRMSDNLYQAASLNRSPDSSQ